MPAVARRRNSLATHRKNNIRNKTQCTHCLPRAVFLDGGIARRRRRYSKSVHPSMTSVQSHPFIFMECRRKEACNVTQNVSRQHLMVVAENARKLSLADSACNLSRVGSFDWRRAGRTVVRRKTQRAHCLPTGIFSRISVVG